MRRVALAAGIVAGFALNAHAQLTSNETARLTAAAHVVRDIRDTIPREYWDRAHCVAVIPDLKKAAFIFGGEYGKGVMSCRAANGWSAPIFLQLAKGSWGFQAGAEQVDVVLLVMNESGVQKLLRNKVNLGADASVAAGPIGRQGQVGTDAYLKAEILSYSKAQGLFAGIDLSGGILRPDEDANRHASGASASPRTILANTAMSAPTEASAFVNALGAASAAATTTAPAGSPSGASSSRSTASATSPAQTATTTDDADVRSRILEMQRALDRLLSEAQAPVGTTGTTTTTGTTEGSATVTVDRSRLVQLRRQLDDILAALDRRR
jgi:lipid-binding SYLF domain-containing protein